MSFSVVFNFNDLHAVSLVNMKGAMSTVCKCACERVSKAKSVCVRERESVHERVTKRERCTFDECYSLLMTYMCMLFNHIFVHDLSAVFTLNTNMSGQVLNSFFFFSSPRVTMPPVLF